MFKHVGSQPAAHRHRAGDAQTAVPGKRTLVEEAFGAAVQQRAGAPAAPEAVHEDVHAAAARGIATPPASLPFGPTIQQLFGRHDISAVQAHTGPTAADSAQAMGAQAYATGDHVVLGAGVDLHTVAHEAAHVVQQRAGVHLQGGVGAAGDAHEQHADAVADRVVRGESAESLLDRHAGGPSGGAPAVQRKWVDQALIEGVPHMLWRQDGDDDEMRDDGWYVQHDGHWLAADVGGEAEQREAPGTSAKKRKSKWDDESSNEDASHKRAKKPTAQPGQAPSSASGQTSGKGKTKAKQFDPKIQMPTSGKARDALALVSESEIGQSVMQRALAASQSLKITVAQGRTATHLDYGGDRQGVDQINLEKDRVLVGEIGSIAQQLVMELTNLANKHRFWKLDYAVQNTGLDEEAYVKANEQIEYEATRTVLEAWKAADGKWGKSNHETVLPALESWETWWAHLTTNNPAHLKVYRDGWSSIRSSTRKLPQPPDTGAPSHAPSSTPSASQTKDHTAHQQPQSTSLVSGGYGGLVDYDYDSD